MVCRLDQDGRLILYISEYPPSWGFAQCNAYFNLTMKVMPLLAKQFERKRQHVEIGSSFFAALEQSVKGTMLPDGEMREYDSASLPPQPGQWPNAIWQGLKYWTCSRCGGTHWWIPISGCGRNADGVPCVSCCSCFPPRPAQALACGRGEAFTDEQRKEENIKLPNVEEWTPSYLKHAERRAWVVQAAIAPTPESAWRLTPSEVRQKLLKLRQGYKGTDGRPLGALRASERPRG